MALGTPVVSVPASKNGRLDRLGVAASTLCAVHCAALPLVVGLLPVVGASVVAHGAFEWGMVGLAATIGTFSLARGHRVHHRHSAWCLFVPGLLVLLAGLTAFSRGCSCCAGGTPVFAYDAV